MVIDIIVVTYESADTVTPCLAAVSHSPLVSRVIVIDNASSDGSADAARQANADVVIENPVNLGFARAVNTGLRHAAADSVLLLNPDARVDAGCLQRLCQDFEELPRVGVAAPLLRDDQGQLHAGAGRVSSVTRRVALCLPGGGRLRPFRAELSLSSDENRMRRAVDVGYVYGAALLVDRALLNALGGLDERFFLFAEDEDLCRRVRQAGRRVLLDGRAIALHTGGASYTDTALIEAQRLFSTYRLLDKWEGSRDASAYHAGVMAAFSLRGPVVRIQDVSARVRSHHPLPGARSGALRKTARLFDCAVRSGVDPIVDATARSQDRDTPRLEDV